MDWFEGWVSTHCQLTAAPPGTREALMGAREAFVDRWRATVGELAECTMRLISGVRVPKWANEHSDAVGRELNDLRHESHRAVAAEFRHEPNGCAVCGGHGQVFVPVLECVQGGRVVGHRDYWPRSVKYGGVLCDRPGCRKGTELREANSRRDRAKRQLELLEYSRRVGLAPAEVLQAVEDEERAALDRARRRPVFGSSAQFDFRALRGRVRLADLDTEEFEPEGRAA